MSRPLRIEYEGAWYHVMNRGRGRRRIFPSDAAYSAFLKTLGEAAYRFRIEVHAYCLMPNHYHLLIHTPMANLARGMRHVDGVYTQRYNRLKGTDGPLFRGRYRALIVDADAYLLSVSRYIHRNPLDGRRPLVQQAEQWRWSSYPAYLDRRQSPEWLEQDMTRTMLGRSRFSARYRAFIEAGVDEELTDFYGRGRQPPVLGDAAFRARVLDGRPVPVEVAQSERREYVHYETVLHVVADATGIPVRDLAARGQRGHPHQSARAIAMWLCQEQSGMRLADIGACFGGIHYSAVAKAIRRLQGRRAVEAPLEMLCNEILSRLDH